VDEPPTREEEDEPDCGDCGLPHRDCSSTVFDHSLGW
jgi:hypothetical protein